MHRPLRASAALFALFISSSSLSACSSSSSSDGAPSDTGALIDGGAGDVATDGATDAAKDSGPPVDEAALIAARPFKEQVPKAYDKAKPTPMILLLHGFGEDGAIQMAYFQFDTLVDTRNVIVAFPDGTIGPDKGRFWNATDACCGAGKSPPDDVAYLTAVVHDVQKRYNVDPKRIYVVGHSNGGFMANRLACDRADLFASAVSLAGAQWLDVSKCAPSRPIAVAQVHGDIDDTILYGGGSVIELDGSKIPYPSATQTVADWAKLDGCTGTLTDSGTKLDLDTNVPGIETTVARYTGCPTGLSAELWTIKGGGHIPLVDTQWGTSVMDFLTAHPMP